MTHRIHTPDNWAGTRAVGDCLVRAQSGDTIVVSNAHAKAWGEDARTRLYPEKEIVFIIETSEPEL